MMLSRRRAKCCTEAVTNEFDWQWVDRALKGAGFIPKLIYHFNFTLVDKLYDVVSSTLFGSDKVKEMNGTWLAPYTCTACTCCPAWYDVRMLFRFGSSSYLILELRLLMHHHYISSRQVNFSGLAAVS